MTLSEATKLGWTELDIIFVTGDAYLDTPTSAVALLGTYLVSKGFRVGVIAQPNINTSDIKKLGSPKLFWAVTAGLVDSMVANYTASGKPRRQCDFTPGGVNNLRPDRAVIQYTNLIRRSFKPVKQLIIIGGIEASLRRIAHYDQKTDSIRRSVLLDSKADILLFGHGDRSIIELANAIKNGDDYKNIRGLSYIENNYLPVDDDVILPSYEDVITSKPIFNQMFKLFADNNDIVTGRRIIQKTGERFLIINPPSIIDTAILDEVNELDYNHLPHPSYVDHIRALETVQFSINSHRGCFGDCAFCAITFHQGRGIVSRSTQSIIREITKITKLKHFKGRLSDIGGATANMYMMTCEKMKKFGACLDKKCLYPTVCKSMNISHEPLIDLLNNAIKVDGIKNIYAASGVRYDLILADKNFGLKYLQLLVDKHISGQLKLAPESFSDTLLSKMLKPSIDNFPDFIDKFESANKVSGKRQFISCYFMVAHPGEDENSISETEDKIKKYLKFLPEQVQIFTPTPSTWSTAEYYTEIDHADFSVIKVTKELSKKERMKERLTGKNHIVR